MNPEDLEHVYNMKEARVKPAPDPDPRIKIVVVARKSVMADYLGTVAEERARGKLSGKEGKDSVWWQKAEDRT